MVRSKRLYQPSRGTPSGSVLLVAAIVSGSMLWWVTLSNLIGRYRHRIDLRALTLVNRIAGLLLAIFGAVLIAEVIWKAGRF